MRLSDCGKAHAGLCLCSLYSFFRFSHAMTPIIILLTIVERICLKKQLGGSAKNIQHAPISNTKTKHANYFIQERIF